MRKLLNGLVGAVIILAGAALLILLRSASDAMPCEHNPSFLLQGTMSDCAARNPRPDVSTVVARR